MLLEIDDIGVMAWDAFAAEEDAAGVEVVCDPHGGADAAVLVEVASVRVGIQRSSGAWRHLELVIAVLERPDGLKGLIVEVVEEPCDRGGGDRLPLHSFPRGRA